MLKIFLFCLVFLSSSPSVSATSCEGTFGLIAAAPSKIDKQNELNEVLKHLDQNPGESDLHLRAGQLSLEVGKLAQAVEQLQICIGLRGPTEENLEALGLAFIKQHDLNSARQVSQILRQRFRFSKADFLLSSSLLVAQGDVTEANNVISQWRSQLPENDDTILVQVRSHLARKHPSAALVELDYILEQRPFDRKARKLKARAFARLRDRGSAALMARVDLTIDPADQEVLKNIVYGHIDSLEFDKAEQVARRHLRLNPNSSDAQALLMRTLVAQGKKAEAEEAANQMVGFDPVAITFYLIQLRLYDGHFDEAYEMSKQLVAFHPESNLAKRALAQSLLGKGRLRNAKEIARKSSRDDNTLTIQALASIGLGQISDAQRIQEFLAKDNEVLRDYIEVASDRFVKHVKIRPSALVTRHTVTVLLEALRFWREGNFFRANEILGHRLLLEPNDDLALLMQAILSIRSYNFDKAREILVRSQKAQSQQKIKATESLYLVRALLHNARKEYDEAVQTYSQVLMFSDLTERGHRQALRGLAELSSHTPRAISWLVNFGSKPEDLIRNTQDDLFEVALGLVHTQWIREHLLALGR